MDYFKIGATIFIATSIPCFILWCNLPSNTKFKTQTHTNTVTKFIEGNETRIETVREVIKKEDKQILSLRDEIARLSGLIAQDEIDLDTVDLIASQRVKIDKQDMLINSLDFKVARLDEIIQLQDVNIDILKIDNKGLNESNERLSKEYRKMKRQRNFALIGGGIGIGFLTVKTLIK